ncbi:DNA polymerase alpha subunit B [Psilocybe cubensis]|uniref:DNA polymerase alpha subunit B n=2 Tax=Psilocybe cubensis TaxID=181762 RepID=A0ACB8H049_PSICU|nr:DNA polymerase alpha subunit B [Psilocybe cubensis]KAH9480575.1 DNA polymerase alpha subunit B [Psilocybe cubensis]
MDSQLREELERVFRDNGHIIDDKLIPECVSICKMYVISPEDFRFKVEAMNYKPSTTRSEIMPITMETLSGVKTQIQQNLAKANAPRAQNASRGLNTAQVDRNRFITGMGRGFSNKTVVQPLPVKQEGTEVESGWVHRSNTVQTSNVSFVGPSSDAESRKKRAYRYMFEKISERSDSLDQLIDDFADLIRAHYEISEFGDPSATTDEEVVVVGRITHDAEAGSIAKLVEGAITIESSRMLSSGARVLLTLDPAIKVRGSVKGVGGFGIYPGAIVVLKGKNGGGGYFLATEVLSIPPLKPSPAAQRLINPKMDPLTSQNQINMMVVCGPFTTDSDIGYKPWRALLHQIKAQKPDVLLLIGPFVDAAHPKIKAGELDVSPANLFRAHFVDPLKAFLIASPGSIVLLLPSVRDLTSTHAAFPQPELDADVFNFNPRIHLLPNPARFTINDVSFAATSVDTLFHLRKEEYFKRGVEVEPLPAEANDLPNDVMANLCRHMLLQRSFYPIFPPPPDLSAEVNLDMSHFDGARMVDEGDLDYAPDVLILPSRLKQFSKVVHTTSTLNPSFLSKGTFGTILLGPRSAGTPLERLKLEVAKLEVPTPASATATATKIEV